MVYIPLQISCPLKLQPVEQNIDSRSKVWICTSLYSSEGVCHMGHQLCVHLSMTMYVCYILPHSVECQCPESKELKAGWRRKSSLPSRSPSLCLPRAKMSVGFDLKQINWRPLNHLHCCLSIHIQVASSDTGCVYTAH